MNAGVVVYCQALDFLGIKVQLDIARIRALDAGISPSDVQAALNSVVDMCAGDGPSAGEGLGQRFRWLTAPRSTVVQPGPVHTGLTRDPEA